jgi:putative transposase
MATIARPRVITKWDLAAAGLPEQVTVSLTDLVGSIKDGLLSFAVAIGLAVLQQLFDEELAQVVGPKGKHDASRHARRHGREQRQVTLGGRRVAVSKPRARSLGGAELELETYRLFSSRDLLTQAALDRMLAGLSTRRYGAGLDPIGAVESKAISRSSVSRRFVEGTERKLAELFGRDLSELDLLAIFIDGIEVAEHSILVALGVDAAGRKHPLGLWEGSTENKTVCTALLTNLIERGLDPEQPRLFVIDGGKAIRAAVKSTFGEHAVVQRCRSHKRRNILDHMPDVERTFIGRKLDRAWALADASQAESELRSVADHLRAQHPGAAASVLEGLEETLTVNRLGLSPSLLRTFKSTNPIESMISVGRNRHSQRQALA